LQLHTLPPKNYFSHFFAISNSYSEVAKTTTGKWLPHYNEKIETIGSAELRSLQKKLKKQLRCVRETLPFTGKNSKKLAFHQRISKPMKI
jgi:hypothetical protein